MSSDFNELDVHVIKNKVSKLNKLSGRLIQKILFINIKKVFSFHLTFN